MSANNSTKVVVFGGLGFLGQYLVAELEKRAYHVTVADLAVNAPYAHYIQCDILNKEQVLAAIPEGAQVVYNLAGFANLDKAIEQPYATLNLNVLGNINVLDACVERKVKQFVYASSAYAMSNKGSFYGISKLTSEKIVEEYYKKFDLPFTILRYGSVYAEMDYENNYIFNLIKEAVKTRKINHGGDGEEVREYIHASDAAQLSVDVIETKKFLNQHVILTGVERMKRKELFMLIKEILNDDIEIKLANDGYHNHYKYTPYSFDPAISKKLIANPHIDIGQGILECIRKAYSLQEEK